MKTDTEEYRSAKHPKLHCYQVLDGVIYLQCLECHDIILINETDWDGNYLGKGNTIFRHGEEYKL